MTDNHSQPRPRRQRLVHSSLSLACALGASAIAGSALAQEGPPPGVFPEIRLLGHSGDLCPDPIVLSSSQGGLSIIGSNSTNFASVQECNVEAEVIVPAGYRFRQPRLCSYVRATNNAELDPETGEQPAQPASRIEITYTFDANGAGGTETFGDPIVPNLDDAESLFCHSSNLITPECRDTASEPTVVPFKIDLKATIQPLTDFQVIALDGEFLRGFNVQWTTCDNGF